MKKLIKMPSIEQFRSIVSNVLRHFSYVGMDENGEAIFDHTIEKPTITFKGTVKLHGTNAGVSYNSKDGLWSQSKGNIITVEKDNAGFAFFAHSNENEFMRLFHDVAEKENIDMYKNTITIYGEWCGGNIQKGVGICNLPKSLFIFGVKITPHTETEEELKANPAYWLDSSYLRNEDVRIYNIEDYPTFDVHVDFNNPQLSQNELIDLTIAVENECPVSKAFGFPNTIGEGLVFSADFKDVRYVFKSKGEKHSSSKVKTLASVDVEKINSILEFIDYSVTVNRFAQACENVFPNEEPIDIKKMGDVIRWVVNDIIKEEMDTMVQNNLEPKEVNKYISSKVRELFLKLYV